MDQPDETVKMQYLNCLNNTYNDSYSKSFMLNENNGRFCLVFVNRVTYLAQDISLKVFK